MKAKYVLLLGVAVFVISGLLIYLSSTFQDHNVVDLDIQTQFFMFVFGFMLPLMAIPLILLIPIDSSEQKR